MSVAPAAFSPKPVFSTKPNAGGPSLHESIAAYRSYAQSQADALVGMTRVLAREIKSGDLDAAQSVYAPTHRYLGRLEPIARSFADLHKRMDATADAYAPNDPAFSGFHRIEQGLFAAHSTAGLSAYADRLLEDALALKSRIATLAITPDLLLEAPAAHLEAVAAQTMGGGSERYSRSDLWTIEAHVDGTQQIFSRIEPQLRARDAALAARIALRLADMSERIARYKDGCGFRTFDTLAGQDRAVLRDGMMALSGELANLKGAFAVELSLADLQKRAALP